MLPRILISESAGFSRSAELKLRAVSCLELADIDRVELLKRVVGANILWVRLRNQIDAEVMDAGMRLRAIATATTGLNHIDEDEARRRGIKIISLRGEREFLENVYATAEHTVSLALSLIRRLPTACQHVANGGWNRDLFLGRELSGMTAGIIGYGRLGRMVARYLRAFGTRICVTDPDVDLQSLEHGEQLCPLSDLLMASDLVTLHVGLSDATRGFFGEREMALMKVGSWFINTARGELIDEHALLSALQSGKMAGAALDVLAGERASGMKDNLLVKYAQTHDNVLITPHIGGCTVESREKTEMFLASRVEEFLRTQHPLNRTET